VQAVAANPKTWAVTGKTGFSWATGSFGQIVTGEVTPGPPRTMVLLSSRPVMQLIALGRGKADTRQVLSILAEKLKEEVGN
jgi:hypothetical protein